MHDLFKHMITSNTSVRKYSSLTKEALPWHLEIFTTSYSSYDWIFLKQTFSFSIDLFFFNLNIMHTWFLLISSRKTRFKKKIKCLLLPYFSDWRNPMLIMIMKINLFPRCNNMYYKCRLYISLILINGQKFMFKFAIQLCNILCTFSVILQHFTINSFLTININSFFTGVCFDCTFEIYMLIYATSNA